MAYNNEPNTATLAEQLARDTKLQGELWSSMLERAATRKNVFAQMTSDVTKNPRGVKSIFCKKRDLKAGGADTVNFSVIGTPGGPGVDGATALSGNESKSLMKTYNVRVGWHRDAVAFTRDQFTHLAAGGMLMQTSIEMLGEKMGLHRQNRMMMRLIKDVSGNLVRAQDRNSTAALLSTDVLSVDFCNEARARLQVIGGKEIQAQMGPNGSPVNGFLVFGGTTAFLPIRNDDGYQAALASGHARGSENALFSGKLVDWQGMPFFEYQEVDEAWDDYVGSPLTPKGVNNVAFTTASAASACKLVTNASNTRSLYWQFFEGFAYKFYDDESPSADSNEYYAWACNPDGSRCFLAYTGSGNDGNEIVITKILAGNDVGADGGGSGGTSTKGYKTVGLLTTGTTSTTSSNVITLGTGNNLDANYVYKDQVQAGAVILQANERGVCYGRSFVLGAMAGMFAYGKIDKAPIEQKTDYGFVLGRGYEEIFGTGVTKNPNGLPVGYLVVEHAISHVGYACPSI